MVDSVKFQTDIKDYSKHFFGPVNSKNTQSLTEFLKLNRQNSFLAWQINPNLKCQMLLWIFLLLFPISFLTSFPVIKTI